MGGGLEGGEEAEEDLAEARLVGDDGAEVGKALGVVALRNPQLEIATFGIFSRAGNVSFTCCACGAQALSSNVDEPSTLVGYSSFKALNGWCRMWQAISPKAPVP